MGYKIAGYDVIGCNEIDPRMMKCYETNHHPQYSYLEDIRDLVKRNNLPEELYHLDILDGSPPCKDFEEAGYYCQHFLLDASKMGVPQKRERVFFICIRHDLGVHFLKVSDLFNVEPYIDMEFNESEIYYGEYADYKGKPIGVKMRRLFGRRYCFGRGL